MSIRRSSAVCACVLAAVVTPALGVTVDYSNSSGSSINLDPADNCGGAGTIGCFSFSAGNSIEITSGSADGFAGGISGNFGVGAITPNGPIQTAPVSGTGVLSIFDGSDTLTADLNWIDITSLGGGSTLNTWGSANLSNIQYGGTNNDLMILAGAGNGINTASFQFTSPTSLTELFTNRTTVTSTSFSGSITEVPVPAAVWLFGSGLVGTLVVARRRGSGQTA